MDALQETMLEQSLMNIDWEAQYKRLRAKYEALWKLLPSYEVSEQYFKAESEKPMIEGVEVKEHPDRSEEIALMRDAAINAMERYKQTHQ